MLRRIFLFWFAVLAVVGLGRDLIASIAAGKIQLLTLGEFWFRLDPSSLNGFQVLLERYIATWLWDPGVVFFLQKPTWVLPLTLTVILILLGRRGR